MRVIRNKTVRPMKVPLPQGKVLHLGPRAEGQIAVHHVDHQPLQQLVTAGDIEILGEGVGPEGHGLGQSVPVDTQGHHPHNSVKKRGNR